MGPLRGGTAGGANLPAGLSRPIIRALLGGMTGIVANFANTLVDLGLPSIVGTLAGVLIGWQLTVRSAAKARREEWQRADERAIETRVRNMATQLDDVVAEMEAAVRDGRWKGLAPMAPSELLEAKSHWDPAWRRFKYRIVDDAMYQRMDGLDQYLRTAQRCAERGNSPSADIPLQFELGVVMARWALAASLYGTSADAHPPFLPTGADWNWVLDHGPSDEPWTCIAAWIDLHRHDDPMLSIAAMAREGLAQSGKVPGYGSEWRWEGHWERPQPSTWRYPPRVTPGNT